jgi:hypothetical protein
MFNGHLVYFMVIWYIFPILVCCAEKNLATLRSVAFSWNNEILSRRVAPAHIGLVLNRDTVRQVNHCSCKHLGPFTRKMVLMSDDAL